MVRSCWETASVSPTPARWLFGKSHRIRTLFDSSCLRSYLGIGSILYWLRLRRLRLCFSAGDQICRYRISDSELFDVTRLTACFDFAGKPVVLKKPVERPQVRKFNKMHKEVEKEALDPFFQTKCEKAAWKLCTSFIFQPLFSWRRRSSFELNAVLH